MKCNHTDCFSCPHPDCILGEREHQQRTQEEVRAKRREYEKRYREKHKVELARKDHERYLRKKAGKFI